MGKKKVQRKNNDSFLDEEVQIVTVEKDDGTVQMAFLPKWMQDAGYGANEKTFREMDAQLNLNEDFFLEEEVLSLTSSKLGRNDPCPCGSGKKYKKCCWT